MTQFPAIIYHIAGNAAFDSSLTECRERIDDRLAEWPEPVLLKDVARSDLELFRSLRDNPEDPRLRQLLTRFSLYELQYIGLLTDDLPADEGLLCRLTDYAFDESDCCRPLPIAPDRDAEELVLQQAEEWFGPAELEPDYSAELDYGAAPEPSIDLDTLFEERCIRKQSSSPSIPIFLESALFCESREISHASCASPSIRPSAYNPAEDAATEEIRNALQRLRELEKEKERIAEEERRLRALLNMTEHSVRVDAEMNILIDQLDQQIELYPLHKALYLLFLLHPEGIEYSRLFDYRDELRTIYLTISDREDLDEINRSIEDLIAPDSKSLNQKVSRINKTIRTMLNIDLAPRYVIAGPRGGAHKIEAAENANVDALRSIL